MRFMAIEKGENCDDFIHPRGVEIFFSLLFYIFCGANNDKFSVAQNNSSTLQTFRLE